MMQSKLVVPDNFHFPTGKEKLRIRLDGFRYKLELTPHCTWRLSFRHASKLKIAVTIYDGGYGDGQHVTSVRVNGFEWSLVAARWRLLGARGLPDEVPAEVVNVVNAELARIQPYLLKIYQDEQAKARMKLQAADEAENRQLSAHRQHYKNVLGELSQ